jgi:hypothetical protein
MREAVVDDGGVMTELLLLERPLPLHVLHHIRVGRQIQLKQAAVISQQ